MKKKKEVITKQHRVHTPAVYQIEASECGAASLSIILQYFHCQIPMEEIRYECGVARDGCSAADIVKAAQKFGLQAKGYHKEVIALYQVPVPCILHWTNNHFVVLEKIGKTYAYINDPAMGHRKIPLQEFQNCYSETVLCFEPQENFVRRQQPSSLFSLLSQRLGDEKKNVLYLIITGLVLVMPGLLIPILTQVFVDKVLLQNNISWFSILITAMVFSYSFQILFTSLRSIIIARLRTKLSLITNYKLLHKMFRLPLTFFEQRYAGELSQRVEINNSINSFLAGNFSELILNIFEAVFYLFLMLLYNKTLTLIGCIGVICSLGISSLLLKPLSSLYMKTNQAQSQMTGALCAGISVSSSMKAAGIENEYTEHIIGQYAKNVQSEQKLGRVQQIIHVLPNICSRIFHIIILIIGGELVISGQCTTGILTAFCQLLSSFVTPINQLILSSQNIQDMKASLTRIQDIDSAKTDSRYNKTISSTSAITKLSGQLCVKNISFGYTPGHTPFIQNFTLQATPGSRIAIIGSSGCGKSTIGKLLAGILVPWEGEIFYDNTPLSQIPLSCLCESMSVINQHSVIFSGTIRENITFWQKHHSEQALYHAVMDADAHEMINSLPGAFEYLLTEDGKNLSGGQRQKIEIARALISNPSILIMDEATSALDVITEQKIMNNIRRRGCTCIIIAHRLSTVRNCDLIMVMNQGTIVECGTHEQLINQKGAYFKLIET